MPQYVHPDTPIPKRAADVIDILGVNPLRAAILRYLWRNPEGGTSGDIGRAIGAGYKTILWHLKQLEEKGAVDSDGGERRIGQRVIYRLNRAAFDEATRDYIRHVKD